MKTLAAGISAAYESAASTLCTCWKVTQRDGTIKGYTSATRDITYGGLTYSAALGFDQSATRSAAGLAVDDMDVTGALASGSLTLQEVMEAYWDAAEVEIFEIQYSDTSGGVNILRTGWLGNVTAGGSKFTAELRGMMHKLQQVQGRVIQENCDADFCDTRCGLTAATYTVTGTVDTVTSRRAFTDAARTEADGLYTYGILTWTSGANDGLSAAVRSYTTGVIELVTAMPRDIAVGDAYSLIEGCTKTPAACAARSNMVNFRGFPDVPTPNDTSKGP